MPIRTVICMALDYAPPDCRITASNVALTDAV